MTSLRVFTCGPYGATLRPEACAQRFPRQVGRRSATSGPRADRIHCHECPVGAAHARGEDAPGVEYSLVDVSAPRPVPRPPSPESFPTMPATTATETRPTRPCAHPNCGAPFVPTHHRSLYCVDHRTPAAALERKTLRDELDAALERAAEATRAKTEPPTPHATTEPESDEAVRQRSTDAATAWATRRRARLADGWVPDHELDHTELAKASADEVLEEDLEHGEKWVPWRWLLDHRSKMLRGLRNVVAATKEAVGDLWTKDRPLAEAVTAKCAFLEADAQHQHDGRLEAEKALSDARTTLLERGERIEVLQRELAAAETRIRSFGLTEDRLALRGHRLLHRATLAISEVECACRDDVDVDEVAAEWDEIDAVAFAQRARELVEYVGSLRAESQVAQVPLDRAMTVCGGGELDRAREAGVLELPTGLVPVRWLLAERAKQIAELAQALNAARADLALEHAAAAESSPKSFGVSFVEAFAEATTPPVPRPGPLPPGFVAAALLRAVGYQVATVESPRGPVIVVEGARG